MLDEEIRNCFVHVVISKFCFCRSGGQDTSARLQAAGTVLNEIMAAPDKGIPEEVLNGAKCIAVVPNMAKGGFIVGGEHGRGVVTCRTAMVGAPRHSFRSVEEIWVFRRELNRWISSFSS